MSGYQINFDFLKDPSFIDLEQKALDAVQRIFPCEETLLNQIPTDKIIHAFQENLVTSSKPFLIRVSGQSGSGKSTQLIPALQAVLRNIPYFKINVGLFASFHPRFSEWQARVPHQMRENTNGFALRSLVLFYKHCILNKVNLLFDMTLLEPEIDLYLMTLAKKMGYRIQTHVLCVPKRISDFFIAHRQSQTGRYVKPSSSSYFFNALAPCLKALTHSSLFNRTDTLILWSHTQTHPIRKTHLHNQSVLRLLNRYQKHRNAHIKNPKTLLKAKEYWMNLICGEIINHV